MRLLCCLALLAAVSAAAQPTRLVLREASEPYEIRAAADTVGLERATLPDLYEPDAVRVIWLGETLLPLGPGSVLESSAEPSDYGEVILTLRLAPPEAEAFEALTEARIGRAIALVLDGRVLTAPRVQSLIPNGLLSIAGLDGMDQASALANDIRKATGALNPRTAFTEAARALRASLDQSTPEAAATAFARAHEIGDPLSIASILHPQPLAELRIVAEEELILVGDSVRWRGGMLEPNRGDTPVMAAVLDIFLDDPPEANWGAYTDEQAAALWIALLSAPLAAPPTQASGAILSGEDRAFVVMTPEADETPAFLSGARVLEVHRVEGLWRVIPPSNWLRGE